jgi:hypothetical protein
METRMEYARKVASKLRELDAAIDALREKAELAAGLQQKAGFKKRIVELTEKRKEGEVLLRRVHEADEANFEEVAAAVESLTGESLSAYKKAA